MSTAILYDCVLEVQFFLNIMDHNGNLKSIYIDIFYLRIISRSIVIA